jgi:hypothetical protein
VPRVEILAVLSTNDWLKDLYLEYLIPSETADFFGWYERETGSRNQILNGESCVLVPCYSSTFLILEDYDVYHVFTPKTILDE